MTNKNETTRLDALYEAAYYLGRDGRVLDRFHDLCEVAKANDQEIANAAIYYLKGWRAFEEAWA